MDLEEIQQAIGGPTRVPVRPEGGSDVVPLSPLGLDRTGAEPFPAVPNAQQGAGAAGNSLTPAPGEPADGVIHVGGNALDSSAGPEQRPTLPGIAGLTAGTVNRPEGGLAPAAVPAPEAGGPQLTSQGVNPGLLKALAPRPGPFGDPSL